VQVVASGPPAALPPWAAEAFALGPQDFKTTTVAATAGTAAQRTSRASSVDENYGKVVDGAAVSDAVGKDKGKGKEVVVVVDTVEATGGESDEEKKSQGRKE